MSRLYCVLLWCALLTPIAFAPRLSFGAQSGRKQSAPSSTSASKNIPRQTRQADPDPSIDSVTTQGPATEPPTKTRTPDASDAPVEIDDGEVVRISSNLVPVPASVVDSQGRAVIDLGVKDFELLVDGEPRPIGDLSRAETPVRMALLFDNSSSLTAGREFEKHAAVRFFRSVLRPVDQAALYSISTEPTLVRTLTGDVKALARAVESFGNPVGATSLFDTIAHAAEYLRPHRGRKVIVIVSDGVDTTSRLDFDKTMQHALTADCQIFVVRTGHSDNTNLRDLAAERRLQEFAGQTGGAVYTPKGTSDLDRAFAQISADLAQQYVLSYYATNSLRDGRFHAFALRVVTRPGMLVRTRKGYYAPRG